MAKIKNPIDSIIFHRVLIEGQKERISDNTLKEFEKLLSDLTNAINSNNEKNTLQTQKKIKKIIDSSYNNLGIETNKQLTELLEYEVEFQADWLDNTVKEEPEENLLVETAAIAALILLRGSKKLNKKDVNSIVNNGLVRGATLQQQINSQKIQLQEMVRRSIVVSTSQGDDNQKIKDDVLKIFNRNRAGTDALIKTTVNAHTNKVAEDIYIKNGIKFYEYVAILDAVTTDICISLNGKIFQMLKGPLPPQHFGCRSFIIPALLKERRVGKFYEFVKRIGDIRLKVDDKNNFKSDPTFNTSLNVMKKEEDI